MFTLGAVEPHRSGGGDGDSVCWDVLRIPAHRHESRVESSGVASDRHARRIEARLGDGVVSSAKLKLHHLAGSSGEFIGREGELVAGAGDLNYVNSNPLGKDGIAQGRDREGVLRKMHDLVE